MLIVDKKYKDYYDGVVSTTGQDKTIVFNRNFIEINDKKNYPKSLPINSQWNSNNKILRHHTYISITKKYVEANHFIVGFCGKLYIGFKLKYNNPEITHNISNLYYFTYNVDELKKYFKISWYFTSLDDFVTDIKNFDPNDIHRELNSPIFIIEQGVKSNHIIKVNPMLKEYQFYKIFDSFNAFQEIEMYISSVLNTNTPQLIEVSNKDKIISKGFDYKWSFRKPPTPK